MAVSDLAQKLQALFVQLGYTWRISGQSVIPVPEDFQETLDRAKKDLYDEPVPSQMEVGRLIIRHHRQGKFDVYLHIGDFND